MPKEKDSLQKIQLKAFRQNLQQAIDQADRTKFPQHSIVDRKTEGHLRQARRNPSPTTAPSPSPPTDDNPENSPHRFELLSDRLISSNFAIGVIVGKGSI